MRVLVAGATGVIGRQLVPLLREAGHQPITLASPRSRHLGDNPEIIVDALDGGALVAAVTRAAPDAIVHLLTAIPSRINPRHMAKVFETTNQLRTTGTLNLSAAAAAVGATRFIVQGLAFAYEPGPGLASEDTPLWATPPRQFRTSAVALTALEEATFAAGGTVLRLGHLYGPGTSLAADGALIADIRAGKLPLVGGGNAVYSFTHTSDAARAIVAALDGNTARAYNIVDDHPAPMHEWLPTVATMIGAPRPKKVPTWVAHLAVGGWGVAYMNRLRGADNTRAQKELGWKPQYPDWAEGISAELTQGQ